MSARTVKLDPFCVDLRCAECGLLSSGATSIRGFRKEFRAHLLASHVERAVENGVDVLTAELMEIAKYYRVRT